MENQNNEKPKRGRPRIYIEVPDCDNRNRFINELYKQTRYHSDPEYRQKKNQTEINEIMKPEKIKN